MLASTGQRRAPALPTVATVSEQGLKDFDVAAWNGMVVPVGTPTAVIERLNTSLRRACADPLILEKMNAAGVDAAPSTPAEFGVFMQSEVQKWAKAVAQAGVQLD